ncbi:divalent metal cation transporter, partial [Pseudomonas sp. FW306-02-F02-AB]
MSGTGLALSALFPNTSLEMWAIITGISCFVLTWLGQYQLFEKLSAILVGIMFVTVVGIAAITAPNLPEIIGG